MVVRFLFSPRLGVVLDSSLTMSHHISSVCRSAYLELRRISAIRPFLTTSVTATLVCSRVLSRIDYCNSLQFPTGRYHFRSDSLTSKNTEQLSSTYLSQKAKWACNTYADITSLASRQTAHWIQTSDTGFPLLWWYIAPLPLSLSLLVHPPQIPLIIFWQTALCPSC